MQRFLCSLAFLYKKMFWSLKPELLENSFQCEDFQRVLLLCKQENKWGFLGFDIIFLCAPFVDAFLSPKATAD